MHLPSQRHRECDPKVLNLLLNIVEQRPLQARAERQRELHGCRQESRLQHTVAFIFYVQAIDKANADQELIQHEVTISQVVADLGEGTGRQEGVL
jgi:hypothetical protein